MSLLWSHPVESEWPQWRGPTRDGIVERFDLPETWPETLELVWREKVGYGYASPVAGDGAVYTFTREKSEEIVSKFDLATGKRLWQSDYRAESDLDWYGSGNHPKSTPALSGDRLVTFGITGVLTCWDTTDGAVVWQRTFDDAYETPYPEFGAAVSPLVENGRVFVHCGGTKGGAFRAFDLASGEDVWVWPEDGPGYASPILVDGEDGVDLVTQSEHFLFAVDAATGDESWRVPFETAHDQNIVTSVASGDTLYYSGYEAGTHAVRLGEGAPDSVWSHAGIHQYMGSPIVVNGLLIGFDHMKKGRLFGLDAATGELLWLTHGRWGKSASIVAIDETLAVLADDGHLYFSPISREGFGTAAAYTVSDSETWAHPAFADGYIVIKDERHVSVWRF